ncbi:MAG: hydrogenase nickel incorporation protein HypB [Bacilli bacterium]|nr:hydrogenase nickel incorporation protein HypB [Bacilli bacterium]MCI7621838.1 hydrogenase nickel incorporation protein HypB [Bacilli bacterium]MDD6226296.1 hydrogenase nickel incorporation protein HypB [Bacilli bacterium]MDD7374541.1 hydrogenase nickel incorporation protein HypB [Bacilli bacterium]MDD7549747.1 hydrogenase nickel incorporation protein HypB [Bacilli bacterium]
MENVKIIELKQSVFEDNDNKADLLRKELKKKKTFLLNVMSSPGSGKTTTLTALINAIKKDYKIGVMEADIDGDIDASDIIKNTGVKAIQLHTGGMCHLDAYMTEDGLKGIENEHFDLIFLENVGNLVCPAEFDTGSSKNLVILSVPEGDDKALKYPLMFEKADVVIINKIDVKDYFDFDFKLCEEYIRMRNKNCEIIKISAKTKEGLDSLINWLKLAIEEWKE